MVRNETGDGSRLRKAKELKLGLFLLNQEPNSQRQHRPHGPSPVFPSLLLCVSAFISSSDASNSLSPRFSLLVDHHLSLHGDSAQVEIVEIVGEVGQG